jgi:Tfp pilus assembly protein PilN
MIPINFASGNYRLVERIHVALIAVSVVFCVIMVGMIWTAVSLRRDISAMDLKLKEFEAAQEGLKPVYQEREQLVKNLSLMSGLMESRKFSWTRLLTRLEAVVPVGVALQHVEFNLQDHTLSIEGSARSPEALRNLVAGLEKSSSFQDPLLKHQSIDKGINAFSVAAVYH